MLHHLVVRYLLLLRTVLFFFLSLRLWVFDVGTDRDAMELSILNIRKVILGVLLVCMVCRSPYVRLQVDESHRPKFSLNERLHHRRTVFLFVFELTDSFFVHLVAV